MRILPLIFTAVLLAACTVPGSSLPLEDKQMQADGTAEYVVGNDAAVFMITPQLVAQMPQYAPASSAADRFSAQAQAFAPHQYRIGSGDVLQIYVWNQPGMGMPPDTVAARSGQVTRGTWVDEQGYVSYPLIGRVQVRGKTLEETRSLLTKRLARYLKNPQVDINIAEFRSQNIAVTGAVRNSGRWPLTNIPMTLLDAVGLAGGFTEDADTSRIRWTHNGVNRTLSLQDIVQQGDLRQNHLLQGGDIVYVPRLQEAKIYVMGEVGKQSLLSLGVHGLSITEALARAEGMNQMTANPTGVFVVRRQAVTLPEDKPIHVYQLNLQDATAYALGTQFALQPEDVVYVTAAPVVRWNRVLSQILPSVTSAILLNNSFD